MHEDNQEQQLQQIELSLNQAKEMIGKRDALRRLMDNKDFKHVISDNYMEKDAARLVALKADPAMQEETHQKNILRQIDAIGTFREYLRTIFQEGHMAEKAVADNEETREQLLAGDQE